MISEQTRNKLTTMAENQQKVYDNGVADGKRAEYDAFWDNIQDYGNREDYQSGFLNWASEYIRPKHKITIVNQNSNQYSIFQRCKNLKKIEKEYFDFSKYAPDVQNNTGGWYYTFSSCESLEYFEDLGMQAGGYHYTWAWDFQLHTVDIMRCNEDCVLYAPFWQCYKLENLTIEGVIGQNFSTQHCPLSPASLKSILKHMKDYYGTADEFKYTLTVKASAWEALEAEGFTDEDYRWIVDVWGGNPTVIESWEMFVGGWLGWNLVLVA